MCKCPVRDNSVYTLENVHALRLCLSLTIASKALLLRPLTEQAVVAQVVLPALLAIAGGGQDACSAPTALASQHPEQLRVHGKRQLSDP